MKRKIFGLATIVILLPKTAQAHEKWFTDASPYPLRPDLIIGSGAIWYVFGTLLVFGVLAVLWRARGGRDFIPGPERFGATERGRQMIYALLPLAIGLHVAIPLFVNGTHGLLLSPNIHLSGPGIYLIGVIEIGIGLSLFYGGLTRLAAIMLALLWATAFFFARPQDVLDNVFFLGIAAFFFMAGRGPISADRLMFPALEPSPRLARYAVDALRIGIGASFVVVAFTEKLANLPLALAFLHHYHLNFTPYIGMAMPDSAFVYASGSVELLVGLSLLFGIFPREII
ncbi:MAG: DoxX protein, partial [Candidatus Eremiobacteraeota bacterium]|nr:DoxX protein [Candidatus Eremiobacteraeota bacterium]